ncbi:uncharacterized protein LOC129591772 [Paramacrobiotus metropolitanus]|uniref:uncharacterized protein LOC129591772 n=1 Tax=Paramacrobiotus metropolitanus TaxID=2943436 RepID=UPI00244596E1|nr:uncharacterized protein LOC129591772 [Paramacrobiotus metropolitanus]
MDDDLDEILILLVCDGFVPIDSLPHVFRHGRTGPRCHPRHPASPAPDPPPAPEPEPAPLLSPRSPDFLDEFLVHATTAHGDGAPAEGSTAPDVDITDNDPFLAELFSAQPPAAPPTDVEKEEPPKAEEKEPEAPPVFKRPFSPRAASPTEGAAAPGERERDVSSQYARMRRELRLQPHPLQRCFLTGIKQKRAETDDGHMAAILNVSDGQVLKDSGKLLLPDVVLQSYLAEAGLEVRDSKVARLVGAMAEQHTGSLVQDAMQIFLDGQHERRRPGGGGGGGNPHPPAANAKDKETASGVSGVSSQTSSSTATSSTGSATGGKPAKGKAAKNTNGKKSGGKGKRRKADTDPSEPPADDLSLPLDTPDLPGDPADTPGGPPDPAAPDGDGGAAGEVLSERGAEEKAASIVSGRDKDRHRLTRREREKEAERRNLLSMELLAPVLREHGYQVGRPPYFVN